MNLSTRRTVWAFAFLLAATAAAGWATSVADIPSPRQLDRWSVDLTGRIPEADLREIDRIADQVKAATGGELAVVVVGSTDGVPSRKFAHGLFIRWGIGSRARNDGALLLAALDDRKVEIILGDAFPPAKFNPVRRAILDDEILPRMRKKDPGGALREGTRALAERIFRSAAGAAVPASPLLRFQPTPETATAPTPPTSDLATTPAPQPETQPLAPPPALPSSPAAAVGAGLGGVLLLLGLAALLIGLPLMLWSRRHKCPQCRTKMVLLDEAKDDAHLSPNELAEERVGSVDYQIWACPGCGFASKERHNKLWTRYGDCPSCGARTRTSVSTVLRQATYDYGGLVRVDERCANCGYANSFERTTPPETRPQPTQTASASQSSMWGASAAASTVASVAAVTAATSHSGSGGGSSSGSGFGGGSSSDGDFGGGRSSDSSASDTSGSGSW